MSGNNDTNPATNNNNNNKSTNPTPLTITRSHDTPRSDHPHSKSQTTTLNAGSAPHRGPNHGTIVRSPSNFAPGNRLTDTKPTHPARQVSFNTQASVHKLHHHTNSGGGPVLNRSVSMMKPAGPGGAGNNKSPSFTHDQRLNSEPVAPQPQVNVVTRQQYEEERRKKEEARDMRRKLYAKTEIIYAPLSMRFFTLSNPIRRLCIAITTNRFYEIIMFVITLLNCVFLALNPGPNDKKRWLYDLSVNAEYFFVSIFVLEVIMKWIALGIWSSRTAYFRDVWNIIDFIVALFGLIAFIPGGSNITAVRVIRVLRILMTAKTIPGVKLFMTAVVSAVGALRDVGILLVLYLIVAGLIGVALFHGTLDYRCFDPINQVFDKVQLCYEGQLECPAGWECLKFDLPRDLQLYTYDNVLLAIVTISTQITKSGWVPVFYTLTLTNRFWIPYVFAVPLLTLGMFYLLNLVTAVVFVHFEHAKQREYKRKQMALLTQLVATKLKQTRSESNDERDQISLPLLREGIEFAIKQQQEQDISAGTSSSNNLPSDLVEIERIAIEYIKAKQSLRQGDPVPLKTLLSTSNRPTNAKNSENGSTSQDTGRLSVAPSGHAPEIALPQPVRRKQSIVDIATKNSPLPNDPKYNPSINTTSGPLPPPPVLPLEWGNPGYEDRLLGGSAQQQSPQQLSLQTNTSTSTPSTLSNQLQSQKNPMSRLGRLDLASPPPSQPQQQSSPHSNHHETNHDGHNPADYIAIDELHPTPPHSPHHGSNDDKSPKTNRGHDAVSFGDHPVLANGGDDPVTGRDGDSMSHLDDDTVSRYSSNSASFDSRWSEGSERSIFIDPLNPNGDVINWSQHISADAAEAILQRAKKVEEIRLDELKKIRYLTHDPTKTAFENFFFHHVHNFYFRFVVWPLFYITTHMFFELFINIIIVSNLIVLAVQYWGMNLGWYNAIVYLNFVFSGIFFLEAVLRVIALGPVLYFTNPYYQFDTFLILLTIADIILSIHYRSAVYRVIASLRILRAFKLLRAWPFLRKILYAVSRSGVDLLYFFGVVCVYVIIFAILGMQFFQGKMLCADERHGELVSCRRNFDNFPQAALTIFTAVMTGATWSEPLAIAVLGTSYWASLFFMIALFLGCYVLLAIFIAILLSHVDQDTESEAIQILYVVETLAGSLDDENYNQLTSEEKYGPIPESEQQLTIEQEAYMREALQDTRQKLIEHLIKLDSLLADYELRVLRGGRDSSNEQHTSRIVEHFRTNQVYIQFEREILYLAITSFIYKSHLRLRGNVNGNDGNGVRNRVRTRGSTLKLPISALTLSSLHENTLSTIANENEGPVQPTKLGDPDYESYLNSIEAIEDCVLRGHLNHHYQLQQDDIKQHLKAIVSYIRPDTPAVLEPKTSSFLLAQGISPEVLTRSTSIAHVHHEFKTRHGAHSAQHHHHHSNNGNNNNTNTNTEAEHSSSSSPRSDHKLNSNSPHSSDHHHLHHRHHHSEGVAATSGPTTTTTTTTTIAAPTQQSGTSLIIFPDLKPTPPNPTQTQNSVTSRGNQTNSERLIGDDSIEHRHHQTYRDGDDVPLHLTISYYPYHVEEYNTKVKSLGSQLKMAGNLMKQKAEFVTGQAHHDSCCKQSSSSCINWIYELFHLNNHLRYDVYQNETIQAQVEQKKMHFLRLTLDHFQFDQRIAFVQIDKDGERIQDDGVDEDEELFGGLRSREAHIYSPSHPLSPTNNGLKTRTTQSNSQSFHFPFSHGGIELAPITMPPTPLAMDAPQSRVQGLSALTIDATVAETTIAAAAAPPDPATTAPLSAVQLDQIDPNLLMMGEEEFFTEREIEERIIVDGIRARLEMLPYTVDYGCQDPIGHVDVGRATRTRLPGPLSGDTNADLSISSGFVPRFRASAHQDEYDQDNNGNGAGQRRQVEQSIEPTRDMNLYEPSETTQGSRFNLLNRHNQHPDHRIGCQIRFAAMDLPDIDRPLVVERKAEVDLLVQRDQHLNTPQLLHQNSSNISPLASNTLLLPCRPSPTHGPTQEQIDTARINCHADLECIDQYDSQRIQRYFSNLELYGNSLLIFPPHHWLRVGCARALISWWFTPCLVFFIVASTLLIAFTTSNPPDSWNHPIHICEIILVVVFFCESAVKMFVHGVILSKNSFLRSPMNVFELTINIIASVALTYSTSDTHPILLVRGLRPLRLVQIISPLSLVWAAGSAAALKVVAILPFAFIIFLMFAVIGTSLFGGVLARCEVQRGEAVVELLYGASKTICEQLMAANPLIPNAKSDVLTVWRNLPAYNFDNVLQSLLFLFHLSSFNMLPHVIIQLSDSSLGPEAGPEKNIASAYAIPFVIIFCIICGFFIVALITGIVVSAYQEEMSKLTDSAGLSNAQILYLNLYKTLATMPVPMTLLPNRNPILWCFRRRFDRKAHLKKVLLTMQEFTDGLSHAESLAAAHFLENRDDRAANQQEAQRQRSMIMIAKRNSSFLPGSSPMLAKAENPNNNNNNIQLTDDNSGILDPLQYRDNLLLQSSQVQRSSVPGPPNTGEGDEDGDQDSKQQTKEQFLEAARQHVPGYYAKFDFEHALSENALGHISRTNQYYRHVERQLDFHFFIPSPYWEVKVRNFFFSIAQHRVFSIVCFAVIIINAIVMILEFNGASDRLIRTLVYLSDFCTWWFTFEIIVKLIGLGPQQYLFNNNIPLNGESKYWSRFDLMIVIVSIVPLIQQYANGTRFTKTLNGSTLSFDPSIFRILRIFRLARLSRQFSGIETITNTLFYSLPSLFSIGFILICVNFSFAVLGVILFEKVRFGPNFNEGLNFQTLPKAFWALFGCLTGEFWNQTMSSLMVQPPLCSNQVGDCGRPIAAPLYFIAFIFIVVFIVLNLFVAIVVSSYSNQVQESLEEKNDEELAKKSRLEKRKQLKKARKMRRRQSISQQRTGSDSGGAAGDAGDAGGDRQPYSSSSSSSSSSSAFHLDSVPFGSSQMVNPTGDDADGRDLSFYSSTDFYVKEGSISASAVRRYIFQWGLWRAAQISILWATSDQFQICRELAEIIQEEAEEAEEAQKNVSTNSPTSPNLSVHDPNSIHRIRKPTLADQSYDLISYLYGVHVHRPAHDEEFQRLAPSVTEFAFNSWGEFFRETFRRKSTTPQHLAMDPVWMDVRSLALFLNWADAPMGFRNNALSRVEFTRLLSLFEIRQYHGYVHFIEVAVALLQSLFTKEVKGISPLNRINQKNQKYLAAQYPQIKLLDGCSVNAGLYLVLVRVQRTAKFNYHLRRKGIRTGGDHDHNNNSEHGIVTNSPRCGGDNVVKANALNGGKNAHDNDPFSAPLPGLNSFQSRRPSQSRSIIFDKDCPSQLDVKSNQSTMTTGTNLRRAHKQTNLSETNPLNLPFLPGATPPQQHHPSLSLAPQHTSPVLPPVGLSTPTSPAHPRRLDGLFDNTNDAASDSGPAVGSTTNQQDLPAKPPTNNNNNNTNTNNDDHSDIDNSVNMQ